MQYLSGYGFLGVVVSIIALLIVKHYRNQHDSGLESCFEENRIKARLYIGIYQKWMVVLFAITMIFLIVFLAGIGWQWHSSGFGICK
jgi:hypothetical protein